MVYWGRQALTFYGRREVKAFMLPRQRKILNPIFRQILLYLFLELINLGTITL